MKPKIVDNLYVVAIDRIIQPAKEGDVKGTLTEFYDLNKVIQRAKEIGGKAEVHKIVKQHIRILKENPLIEEIKNEWKKVWP